MKPKLLIVEDNELTRILLYTIFDSLGFDIKEIARGDEVIPYLANNTADIMILDLELPGMSGDQVYTALKKNPKTASIPIIPFTAHNDRNSPISFTNSLIWAEYQKSGKIPTIIYKMDEGADQKNITKEIIDEVARQMMNTGIPITNAMADYFIETRGLDKDKLRDSLK